MIFNFDHNSLDIEVELIKDEKFTPTDETITQFDQEDLDDIKSGEACFYQAGLKVKDNDLVKTYYFPTLILSSDSASAKEEFIFAFREQGILDQLVDDMRQ